MVSSCNTMMVLSFTTGDPIAFLRRCLESPTDVQIKTALENLIKFGAILPTADLPLTPLGFHLAKLPVDMHIGKMLVMGCLFGCIEPSLTIAASLSGKCPFVVPVHKKADAHKQHASFVQEDQHFSDHITIVNAYNRWVDTKKTKGSTAAYQLCSEFFLNATVLKEMEELREYFKGHLREVGLLGASKTVGSTVSTVQVYDEAGPCSSSTEELDTLEVSVSGSVLVADENSNSDLLRCVICAGGVQCSVPLS